MRPYWMQALPNVFVSLFAVQATGSTGGRQRGSPTGASIGPGVYDWNPKRLYMDVSAEFYVRKTTSLFARLRNLTDVTDDTETYAPSTPALSRLRTRTDYGALWQFGLKSSF